ncbi:MAG: hypothetical protein ACOX2L_05470 [Anaerolineae bacterium]
MRGIAFVEEDSQAFGVSSHLPALIPDLEPNDMLEFGTSVFYRAFLQRNGPVWYQGRLFSELVSETPSALTFLNLFETSW